MQEPRDGDFVAYIDALQRESAARLAAQHLVVTQTTPASKTSGHLFEEKAPPAPAPASQRSVERFARDPDARIVKAVVAGVVGAVFLLAWLGDGGPFSFIVAIALLAYAAPRLLRALRRPTAQPANRAAIDQVFGRSAPRTPGTGK